MADKKKKERAEKYEDKLRIKGSLDEVLKVSVPRAKKKNNTSNDKTEKDE